MDNSFVLVGSKVICICVQVQVKLATSAPLFTLPPACILRSPTRDKPWYLCQGKTCRCTISHPALGVINEGLKSINTLLPSATFLAPLPGTPAYKIGELHTIFYLFFLVLSVYLLVFTFVSLIKKYQKYMLLL